MKSKTYERNGKTYMTSEYYTFLLQSDLVVDGSAGGLIQGPSLPDGGVQLAHFNKDADIFMPPLTSGWHFLINAFAYHDYKEQLEAILRPSLVGDTFFMPYAIPDDVDIITIRPKEVNGSKITPVLFFGTNFMCVVSKEVARTNLRRLTDMNRQAWKTHMIDANPSPTIRESAILSRFLPKSDN